ncbi:MAG: hypothetical protein HY000_34285 [Planctomycetes bacterium]|nr:hypothetical protein [Planctomycetota bacterium]
MLTSLSDHIDRNRRAAGMVVATSLALAGCGRSWYRQQADQEAKELIAEKSDNPRWSYPNTTTYMDPRSRFFDPSDPDHPPMPPDDPVAHRLMHCVDCKRGYAHWHDHGDLADLENPAWRQYLEEYLPKNQDGTYRLTLEDAVELAYLHSPNYQQELEDLYLSALDVAFERFRFDVQFFGGNDTTFVHNGRLRSAFGETNTLRTATDLRARKLFPTGGQLVVDALNSFVWQFAGPDTNRTTSLLSFNLLQPLLRLGGRDVVLETLTRSERGLLANLRALTRYRQMFYVQTAMGAFAFGGPQRQGGFFGGAGLTGFQGTGQGGFGEVGGTTGFGRFGQQGQQGGAGGAGFAGGGAGLTGGFIGLAQLQQEIRNREANASQILREQARMEANFEAGRINAIQVDQFRQLVQTQLSTLVQARLQFESLVDTFLTSLGLPPNLPVQVDDRLVRQFQFFDPAATELQQRVSAFGVRLRQVPAPSPEDLKTALQEVTAQHQDLSSLLNGIHKDFELLRSRTPQRLENLPSDQQRALFQKALAELERTFEELQTAVAATAERIQNLLALLEAGKVEDVAAGLVDLVDTLSDQLIDVSLVQARARLEAVAIEPLQLTGDEAFAIARANRLDLMNQRAAVVDQWRLIAFNADRLESDLNVVLSGDLSTKRDNPLDFRGSTGSLTAGLLFDAPLTRLGERNQYRESLVNYQAVRRGYIQFEDQINQNLRLHLRTLQSDRELLERQREAVGVALRAFDNSRLALRQPPAPAQPGEVAAAEFGPTLARDLIGALSDLLSSQNNFMSIWIQYEVTRMQLYRDLGILKLDENGLWVSEPLEPYIQQIKNRSSGDDLPPTVVLDDADASADSLWLEPPTLPTSARTHEADGTSAASGARATANQSDSLLKIKFELEFNPPKTPQQADAPAERPEGPTVVPTAGDRRGAPAGATTGRELPSAVKAPSRESRTARPPQAGDRADAAKKQPSQHRHGHDGSPADVVIHVHKHKNAQPPKAEKEQPQSPSPGGNVSSAANEKDPHTSNSDLGIARRLRRVIF